MSASKRRMVFLPILIVVLKLLRICLRGSLSIKIPGVTQGKSSPGDVQRMTAGAGLFTQKCRRRNLLRKGGSLHGFHIILWVKLNQKQNNMIQPRISGDPLGKNTSGKDSPMVRFLSKLLLENLLVREQ